MPLLEFGREREGVDLSKVVLTRHNLKHQGKQPIYFNPGDAPTLAPITGSGSGSVQVKEKALLGAELDNAIIGALDAHTLMSTKALNSPEVKKGIMKVLLEHSGLWEKLREAG